jgi:hypothetical protein
MINQWLEELKAAPERLAEQRSKLSSKRSEFTYNARLRAHMARGNGSEVLWTFRATALERVGSALDRATDVPVLSKITDPAAKLVHDRLVTFTAPIVPDYDAQNAKTVISAVKQMHSRIELAAVRRHELSNKARKTVMTAVEARIAALPALALVA